MPSLSDRLDIAVIGVALALLGTALGCGLLSPPIFAFALAGTVAAAIVYLVFCFPVCFSAAWLLIAGMSLEMASHDLIGDQTYQPVIAIIKGVEIGLAAICVLRFGFKPDLLCPVWAFAAIFVAGLVHGLYPGLSSADSLRSAIGSMAPFAFCFVRVPPRWAEALIRTAKWCPLIAVLACLPLAAAGVHPLFVDSGGARLAGLGHPAFLANVCLPAIYACLVQLYREGRRGDLLLFLSNFLILILTGARAPFAYAAAVSGLSLLTIRSSVFLFRDRLFLVLAALAALPLIALAAGSLGEVRLFNVMLHETGNLSGRGLLWPWFEQAAGQSPWFGWGAGAGNSVIPPNGQVARILHTWAAHNEYLRIDVEGGAIGEALLIAMFVAWALVHTARLSPAARRIMRLGFVALACHAATDNVLISTPACVMFAFATAVFARGAHE